MMKKDTVMADRWFFAGLGIALAITVIWGFAPTYYLRTSDKPPLSGLFVIHGGVFSAWFALFLAQTLFIRTGHVRLHRIFGWLSVLLVPVLLLYGMKAGFDALDRGVGILTYPPETFFFMSASDMAGFALLYAAALWFRQYPEQHKRLMAFAAISLILPAAGRIADQAGLGPLGAAVQIAFALSVAVHDWRAYSRLLSATVFGGSVIALKLIGIVTLGASQAWIDFVSGLR